MRPSLCCRGRLPCTRTVFSPPSRPSVVRQVLSCCCLFSRNACSTALGKRRDCETMAHRYDTHPWASSKRLAVTAPPPTLDRTTAIAMHVSCPPSASAHRHTATAAAHPFCILLPLHAHGWRPWSCWSEAERQKPSAFPLCARALASPSSAVLWARAPSTHTQTQPEALALRQVRRPQPVSTAPATPSSRPDPPMARPDPRGRVFSATTSGPPEAPSLRHHQAPS